MGLGGGGGGDVMGQMSTWFSACMVSIACRSPEPHPRRCNFLLRARIPQTAQGGHGRRTYVHFPVSLVLTTKTHVQR